MDGRGGWKMDGKKRKVFFLHPFSIHFPSTKIKKGCQFSKFSNRPLGIHNHGSSEYARPHGLRQGAPPQPGTSFTLRHGFNEGSELDRVPFRWPAPEVCVDASRETAGLSWQNLEPDPVVIWSAQRKSLKKLVNFQNPFPIRNPTLFPVLFRTGTAIHFAISCIIN